MIFHDSFGDVLEQGRLACTGRGNDESALAATDGCEHVDHSCGEAIFARLKLNLFVRIDSLEFFEKGHVTHGLWHAAINLRNTGDLRASWAFLRDALDIHAFTQAVLTDEVARDEGVIWMLGIHALTLAKEAVTFGSHFEHAISRFWWSKRYFCRT